MDHQAVYDPETKRMLLYGGDAKLGHKFRDLWELEVRPDIEREALLRAAGAKQVGPGQAAPGQAGPGQAGAGQAVPREPEQRP